MRRVALLTIPIAVLAGALAACSSDSASTGDASTDAATSVGGTAVCDEATLTTAVEDLVASEPDSGEFQSLDGYECADGWAVTFPTVGAGDEGYTYTQVFQAEGQFWVPITDRNTVCGTTDVEDPAAYPSDSQVPESIWQSACNTN